MEEEPMSAARLKGVGPWVWEARYVWMTLAVILAAIAAILVPPISEVRIRITGLILQLFGIGTVVWGISETRAFFGHPTFSEKAKRWLERLPLLKQTTVVSAKGGAAIAFGGKVRVIAIDGAGENATIEQRVDALERNIKAIHDRISQELDESDSRFSKVEVRIESEVNSRKEQDAEVLKKLDGAGTGGMHISAIGACLLFVGVPLSTSSPEIYKFLQAAFLPLMGWNDLAL
ncbi:MAG: hypothetical protein GC151_13285 [Betaproteobacteria bacterium]|nr:hypothetical protein [Betaproteobacteria bacterium]